uniref:Uncharacterized protein n=1 Tax=Oryza glumipatula TaxID=40148 RepID=A0A0E0ABU3_9ORYZ
MAGRRGYGSTVTGRGRVAPGGGQRQSPPPLPVMRRVGQPRHARDFTPLLWCRSLTTIALCFGRRRSDRCQSSATVPNPPRYHQSASGPLLPPPSPLAGGSGSPDVEGVALADFF